MEDSQIYRVEKILDKRKRKGRFQYLIKWAGYPESVNSWEPCKNVMDKTLIVEFLKRSKKPTKAILPQQPIQHGMLGLNEKEEFLYILQLGLNEKEASSSGTTAVDPSLSGSSGTATVVSPPSGTATVDSSHSGTATVVSPPSGTATVDSSHSGTATVVSPPSGTATVGSSHSGTATVVSPPSGTATVDSSYSGIATVVSPPSGTASVDSSYSGIATVVSPPSGTATVDSSHSGTATVVSPPSGTATVDSSHSGTATVVSPPSGTATVDSSYSGIATVVSPPSGTASVDSSYSGIATVVSPPSGTATVDSSYSGIATVVSPPSGTATVDSSYSGIATVVSPPSGTATVDSSYSGIATVVSPPSGTATVDSSYSGIATVVSPPSGTATVDSSYSGIATVVSPPSGTATVDSSYSGIATVVSPPSGTATVDSSYSGIATVVSPPSGTATVDSPHSGTVSVVSSPSGSPATEESITTITHATHLQFEFNGLQFFVPKTIFQMANGSVAVSVADAKEFLANLAETSAEANLVTSIFKRRQKRCPECRQMKVDLVNHMKRIHGWSKEKAAKILQITNQRKIKEKRKRKVTRVNCNLCEAKVFNLRSHMKRCHPVYGSTVAVRSESFYGSSSKQPEEVDLGQVGEVNLPSDGGADAVEGILDDFINEAEVEPLKNCHYEEYILPENLEIMVADFQLWQQGPQGGGNKEVTAIHNAEMLKRICRQLNAKDLSCLLSDSTLWQMFYIKKSDGSWSGHTSRTYMVALKKFMSFICKDARRNKYSTSDERVFAQAMYTDFSNWSKSFKRQIGVETAKKRIKQAEVLLTADKMKKYRASLEYRRAFTLLAECASPEFVLSQRSFVIMRNYLLFTLNWRNANRAGVLAEFTVDNFNTKKKFHCRETGTTEYMMSILNHKTLGTHGPAKIALTGQLVEQMNIYRDHIRSKLVIEPDCPFFFTTFTGKSIIDSVSHPISAHAKASGLGHMTSNDCRRSATTITREVDPSMARNVAKHMNHSEITADRVYDIASKDKACFNSVRFLENCYSGNLQPTSSIVEVLPAVEKRQLNEDPQMEQSSKKLKLPVLHLDDSASIISSCSGSIIPSSLHASEEQGMVSETRRQELLMTRRSEYSALSSNATYTQEDRDTLKSLFTEMLEQKTNYTGATVDVIVKSSYPHIFEKYGSYSIRNKFRDCKSRFLKKLP